MKLLCAVLALVALSAASDVLDLTTGNFDSILKNTDLALVEFFAPWCVHLPMCGCCGVHVGVAGLGGRGFAGVGVLLCRHTDERTGVATARTWLPSTRRLPRS